MRRIPWWMVLVVATVAWPATSYADGPGSGDEVTSKRLSPSMLRRIWKASRARRSQERQIRELKSRIAALRAALPKLQQQAMREADYHRSAQQRYQRSRQAFNRKWARVSRLFRGRNPLSTYTARYGLFRIHSLYSADIADWKRSYRRKGNADGDDFYIYSSVNVPKDLVGKERYAVDWTITGQDFQGQERSLYYVYNYSFSREYRKIKWARFRVRRRITGLGLSPGWYDVKATLKVKGKSWLQRATYGLIRISQVNPLVSAPPASRYRHKDETKIKLERVSIRTRGVPRGHVNPRQFSVRGKYRLASELTGSDKHVLVGADVYGLTRRGRPGSSPLRTAFRYRLSARRTHGRFGSRDTTHVKDLGQGLRTGKYVLRVWVLVGGRYKNYWAYEDHPFEVTARGPRSGR